MSWFLANSGSTFANGIIWNARSHEAYYRGKGGEREGGKGGEREGGKGGEREGGKGGEREGGKEGEAGQERGAGRKRERDSEEFS